MFLKDTILFTVRNFYEIRGWIQFFIWLQKQIKKILHIADKTLDVVAIETDRIAEKHLQSKVKLGVHKQKTIFFKYLEYICRQLGKKIVRFFFIDSGNIMSNPVVLMNHFPDVSYSEDDHFFYLKYIV